jgi:hypothetical protein
MQVRTIHVMAVFVLSTAIAGLPQTASTPNAAAGRPKSPPAPMLPFTAEFKATMVQVLASGATISTESTRTQARDGQGRYYEANTGMPQGGRPQITNFHISDPVAGTETRWDSQRKKATVYQLPPEDQRHGCWQSESGISKWSYPLTPEQRAAEKAPEVSAPVTMPTFSGHQVHENLGTDVIQGLQVHGSRTTFTTPAGQAGNDQPLVRTSEAWYSDEYRLQARWINDDPQQGKTTRELVGFTPGEPDPSLFQPPQGYEVVTEELHQVACHS